MLQRPRTSPLSQRPKRDATNLVADRTRVAVLAAALVALVVHDVGARQDFERLGRRAKALDADRAAPLQGLV